jgi:putative PIN family toxin of toxin-antitoxin system
MISALLFGGTPGKLIALWKNETIHPLISADIFQEYMRVMAYPKFGLTEKEISFLLYSEILPWFQTVEVTRKEQYVQKDSSDNKFIACAVDGQADTIVSGDRHLLDLETSESVQIMTPTQFLEKVTQKGL